MKHTLLSAIIVVGLSSCGSIGSSTPSSPNDVTGKWTGTLTLGSSVKMEVILSNVKADTSFSGSAKYIGTQKTTSASASGVEADGTFSSAFDGASFSCKGVFVDHSSYSANCKMYVPGPSGTVTVYPTIALRKQ